MKTQVEEKFSDFFDEWVCKLEEYHQALLLGVNGYHSEEADCVALVNKLTAHQKEYYTVKWAAAHEDILAFYSSVWLSPLENAYSWITGWKPSMAFRLVDRLRQSRSQLPNLADMSEQQLKRIDALRMKMKAEEDGVEMEMARQQMAMADRSMLELAKLVCRAKTIDDNNNNNIDDAAVLSRVDGLVKVALENLMAGLEKVMKMADCMRLKTLKGVLDILNPTQSVNFLAATSMIQIHMRKCGKKRDNKS